MSLNKIELFFLFSWAWIYLTGLAFLGAQYLAHNFGGNVDLSSSREYGRANLVSISDMFSSNIYNK